MIWIPFALIVGFILFKYFIKPITQMLLLKFKYGDQVKLDFLPFLGLMMRMTLSLQKYGDSQGYFREIVRKNPRLKFYVGNFFDTIIVQMLDPSYYKHFLLEHEKFLKFRFLNDDRIMQEGIFFVNGDQWKHQRSLLGTAFLYENQLKRAVLVNQLVKDKIQQLKQSTNTLTNVFTEFLDLTGGVLVKSFFGDDLKGKKINGNDPQTEIAQLIKDEMEVTGFHPFYALKHYFLGPIAWKILPSQKEQQLYNRVTELRKFAEEIINKRKDYHIKNGSADQDFLDILLKDHLVTKKTSIEEVVQIFNSLFFAGTDTTATVITWSIYCLAQNQDIQERVYQEVKSIVENDMVPLDKVGSLKLVHALAYESMRIYPPVFGTIGRLATQDVVLKDFRLKKGQYCNFIGAAIGVNPKNYSNPMEVDLDRYSESKQDPFLTIPFSAGPRNCIGQHMAQITLKIILAVFIKNFKFHLAPGIKYQYATRGMYVLEPQEFRMEVRE